MYNDNSDMTLRNCFDKGGNIINDDTKLDEFAPLQEILDMYRNIHDTNSSVPLEKVG